MTEHAEHSFATSEPVDLAVELGRGALTVRAADTATTQVRVQGRDADQVRVEQRGNHVSVVAPRQRAGFLTGDTSLRIDVTVPADSGLVARTGSADVEGSGRLGAVAVRSGSGDVRLADVDGPSVVETGSGDVRVDIARGDLRAKSGSGLVALGRTSGSVSVSTGSGDVRIDSTEGPTVAKTGSGDLSIRAAHRGQVSLKGASGDVHVGIPAGVPVWTDITTVSGEIRSSLSGAGEPRDGQAYVELRARTVSGDVVLVEA
jgi:hypothetical protein